MVEDETVSEFVVDRWGGHQLLVSDQDDSSELARWAGHGLARGDKLLYAADERHPDEESLTATLCAYGVDAAGAVGEGRIAVVAPAQFYDLAGYEQLVDRGLRDGHGGVRSFGGPRLAAQVLDPPAFAEFERLLDRLWTTRGAAALCCYPPARAGGLGEAIGRHPSGWRQHMLHVHHHDQGRWGVHGEVDTSNAALFTALLTAVTDRAATTHTGTGTGTGTGTAEERGGAQGERGQGPLLVLDCAGLDYSGVAAWRAAVAGTETFRAGGGRVTLTGLRPHTVRMLQVTGFAPAFDLPPAADARGSR